MRAAIKVTLAMAFALASLQANAQKKPKPVKNSITAQDDWETPAKKKVKTNSQAATVKIAKKPKQKSKN